MTLSPKQMVCKTNKNYVANYFSSSKSFNNRIKQLGYFRSEKYPNRGWIIENGGEFVLGVENKYDVERFFNTIKKCDACEKTGETKTLWAPFNQHRSARTEYLCLKCHGFSYNLQASYARGSGAVGAIKMKELEEKELAEEIIKKEAKEKRLATRNMVWAQNRQSFFWMYEDDPLELEPSELVVNISIVQEKYSFMGRHGERNKIYYLIVNSPYYY